MSLTFSQRMGLTPIKTELQIEEIDDGLKNGLWNVIYQNFLIPLSNLHSEKGAEFVMHIWIYFYKKPIDEFPHDLKRAYTHRYDYVKDFSNFIKKDFYRCEWFRIYDIVEMISSYCPDEEYADNCNIILKRELSGYRLIDGKIIQITSEEEVVSIEEAIENTDPFNSVNTHLSTALKYFSDRENPDFRNSVKESISAVEAICSIIVDDEKTTLGKVLDKIDAQYSLHPALKKAFSALYGYTSDSGGIRHALLEDDVEVKFEDAKFMLVACSAFINYLKDKKLF